MQNNSDNRTQNFEQAYKFMMQNVEKPITHDFIQKLHAKVIGSESQISKYPTFGFAHIFNPKTDQIIYTSPDLSIYPAFWLITGLLDWYFNLDDNLSPSQIAARFHWGFVKIHPFDDGNGRTARLCVYHILLNHGYTDVQCRKLEQIFFDDRDGRYVDALLCSGFYTDFKLVDERWLKYMHDCDEQIKNS